MSTVSNGQYNEGALVGRLALKDLSNSGKFTNILNVVPRRMKTSISGSNITVSRGSTLTVLYGLSETDLTSFNVYTKLTEDLTIDTGAPINTSNQPAAQPANFKYLIYNYDAKRLELGTYTEFVYYKEAVPAENIEANTFLNAYKQKCSLPLGYLDEYNTWHPFYSIGFFGRLSWVDAGVEALCPYGMDDKGGLNIIHATIPQLVITEISDSELNTFANGVLMMSEEGVLSVASTLISSTNRASINEGYNFVSGENIIVDSLGFEFRGCKVATQSMTNGMFYDLSSVNTYAPANFNEISDRIEALDSSVLHTTGKEDITEEAYGDKHFYDEVTFDNINIKGGSISNATITSPFEIQCPQITEDVTNLTNISTSLGYKGQFGGLSVKYDAYITSIGNPTTNPNLKNHIQLVGASQAGQAGIAFGNKQTVRLMGDSGEGNMYVTLGDGASILPDKSANNKYSIGSANYKFKEIFATTFNGTATRTYWADLAEKYTTDKEYPIGTVMKWGGLEEITEANNEEDLAGVISEAPGYLMNSECEGQPLALAGRVKVRVIGKVNKHDRIILSDIPGVGISVKCFDEVTLKGKVIGRALECKGTDGEGLVMCVVQFSL